MNSWVMAIAPVLLAGGTGDKSEPAHAGRDLADIIGSSHVAGRYHLTDQDFLNEGADVLLGMGSRVIKLWFPSKPEASYPFNSQWPKVSSLRDLAKTEYFRRVFAKPFTTYILEAERFRRPGPRSSGKRAATSSSPADDDDDAWESQQFYDVARYLLTEYKGTGKTFIFQNWEGDWVLTPPGSKQEATAASIQQMIRLLNARQDGVDRARAEVGMDGVIVAHAAEVNLVAKAMKGGKSVTNDVLPHTHCDLYSYSAYDTCLKGPQEFRDALDYLASKAPDSTLFGASNVYVGEFGAPENTHDQLRIIKYSTETALQFGARYIVYWEVYCNEPKDRKKDVPVGHPTREELRGFWLIRPDGSHSPAYDYFAALLHSAQPAHSQPARGNSTSWNGRQIK